MRRVDQPSPEVRFSIGLDVSVVFSAPKYFALPLAQQLLWPLLL